MADYNQAFQLVIANEGGYVNDPDDPGGETYKGVARKIYSKWEGWTKIDMLKRQQGFPANLDRDVDLQQDIVDFYRLNYWDRIKGDDILNQDIANSVFDFAVNAGVSTSASLAQMVVDSPADGVIGPKTIEGINSFNPDHFLASFTVRKISRYVDICLKRPESKKYFFGWVIRSIKQL